MSREIKFRAKALDGPWEYGELHLKNCRHPHIHTDARATIYIDPKTVGQFTGLHDKNGKEIYEGDIVSDIKGKMKVDGEWVDQTEIFAVEYHGAAFNISHLSLVSNDSVEVIGNIHDNPELLKGGKQ